MRDEGVRPKDSTKENNLTETHNTFIEIPLGVGVHVIEMAVESIVAHKDHKSLKPVIESLAEIFIKRILVVGSVNGGAAECKACPEGSVSQSGQEVCTKCEAGFGPNKDATKCEPCPQGFYNSKEGGICNHCPPNTIPNRSQTLCEVVDTFLAPLGRKYEPWRLDPKNLC